MCGCLGGNKNVVVYRPSTTSLNIKSSKQKKELIGCQNMYEELRELDLKIISLLKVKKDSILKQANKQMRVWIRNLVNECPDNYEYQVLKEYVENEYTEYNS